MSTKLKWMAAVAVVAAGMTAGNALAVDEHKGHEGHEKHAAKAAKIVPQTTCPVMGGKVNKALYVDQDGQRIYICCKGCVAPLKKDFAKYAKKIEAAGETVATLQTTCPVMGGKVNKALYVDHDGQRIYVCCKGCIAPIQKDPGKYIKKLAEAGEVPAAVPQEAKPTKGAHKGHNH